MKVHWGTLHWSCPTLDGLSVLPASRPGNPNPQDKGRFYQKPSQVFRVRTHTSTRAWEVPTRDGDTSMDVFVVVSPGTKEFLERMTISLDPLNMAKQVTKKFETSRPEVIL